jgi:hypothetical protein
MTEPAQPRARPAGLFYAALCFLVPFGGVLPVVLAATPPADAGGARLALGYWWHDTGRR